MNFFGIHICMDEIRPLLASSPFLLLGWFRVKMWLRGKQLNGHKS